MATITKTVIQAQSKAVKPAVDVPVDPADLTGILAGLVTNVQELAQAVDALKIPPYYGNAPGQTLFSGADPFVFEPHALTYSDVGAQPTADNLSSLAGLAYASGAFVKMTGENTFALDTNTYLTSVTAHNLLSATHGDTTPASVVRGDIITGQGATPKWTRLAASIPASGLVNYLGLAYGDTEPGYKALFDTTNPAALGTAGPGSQVLAARRDHVHAMPGYSDVGAAPAFVSGVANYAWMTPNGAPGVPSLRALVAADIPALAYQAPLTVGPGLLGNGTAQYQLITTGATPFAPVYSYFYVRGTTGGTTKLSVTTGKTLELISTGDFSLTLPATGVAGLLGVANLWTAQNQITVATATAIGLVLKTSDDDVTKNLLEVQSKNGVARFSVGAGSTITHSPMTSLLINSTQALFAGTYVYDAAGNSVTGQLRGIRSSLAVYGSAGGTGGGVSLSFSAFSYQTAGTLAYLYGVSGYAINSGSGLLSLAVGQTCGVQAVSTGNIAQGAALLITSPVQSSSGIIEINYGAQISNQGLVGMTIAAGLMILSQSGASSNYAIYTNSGLNRFGDQLSVVGSADRQQLTVSGYTTAAQDTALVGITRTDTAAGISDMLSLTHLGDTTTAGNGGAVRFYVKDSTTPASPAGYFDFRLVDNTHVSYKSGIRWYARDYGGARLCVEMQASGTAPMIGFLGAAPVIRPASANQAAVSAQTQQALTDSTGGTPSTTLALIAGALYATDAPIIANAIASLAAQLAKIKADVTATKTFQDQLRTDMIALGLIKGAA